MCYVFINNNLIKYYIIYSATSATSMLSCVRTYCSHMSYIGPVYIDIIVSNSNTLLSRKNHGYNLVNIKLKKISKFNDFH